MAEELQNLLDRIQKDGVDRAEVEATRIASEAKQAAEAIVAEATKQANAIRADAEKDAEAFEARARVSLQQAARDVVLSVGETLQTALREVVRHDVADAMTPEALQGMLASLVEAYLKEGTSNVEILVSESDRAALSDFFMSRFAATLKQGVDIKADDGVVRGFRVSVADEQVQHDFTDKAVTDALCQILRPHLAQIVREALGADN